MGPPVLVQGLEVLLQWAGSFWLVGLFVLYSLLQSCSFPFAIVGWIAFMVSTNKKKKTFLYSGTNNEELTQGVIRPVTVNNVS